MIIKKDTRIFLLTIGAIATIAMLGGLMYVPPPLNIDNSLTREASSIEVSQDMIVTEVIPESFSLQQMDAVPVDRVGTTTVVGSSSVDLSTTSGVVVKTVEVKKPSTGIIAVPSQKQIPAEPTPTPTLTAADLARIEAQIKEVQKVTDALVVSGGGGVSATDTVTAPVSKTKTKPSRRSRAS